MSATLESLLSQVTLLASNADLSLRYKISNQLSQLARSIATPRQIMTGHGFMYTEQVMVKIASDLDIFTILTQSETSLKTEDIASTCGCDPVLAGLTNIKPLAISY